VGIIINSGGGGIAICTGSLIAPNLVLSAHHCVADIGATQCSSTSFGTQYAATAFRITTSETAAYTYFNQGAIPQVDNSTWFGVRTVWTAGGNVCGQDMSLLELTTNISGV